MNAKEKMELAGIGIELITAVAGLVKDAISENDPAKLKKVGDVLPRGHELKARLALIAAKKDATAVLKPK